MRIGRCQTAAQAHGCMHRERAHLLLHDADEARPLAFVHVAEQACQGVGGKGHHGRGVCLRRTKEASQQQCELCRAAASRQTGRGVMPGAHAASQRSASSMGPRCAGDGGEGLGHTHIQTHGVLTCRLGISPRMRRQQVLYPQQLTFPTPKAPYPQASTHTRNTRTHTRAGTGPRT